MLRKFVHFILKLLGGLFRSRIEPNTGSNPKQPEQKTTTLIINGDINITINDKQ